MSQLHDRCDPAALRTWMLDDAAPLWLSHGLDRDRGGYFDQLDPRNATNACAFKRLRVTCRQIFVFARLDRLGVAGAHAAMEHGLTFLIERLRHPDGGFVRAVELDGAVLDPRRDLYDLAFAVFALAAAFERSGDRQWLNEALQVLAFIRRQLAHPDGGFAEGVPATLPRRQNPHMHLLEACNAWLPLADDERFRLTAQAVLTLAERRFWCDKDRCLYEYFEDDWALCAQPERRVFEPGHHFEWIWLLDQCRRNGLAVPDIEAQLAKTALDRGFCPSSGLPYGEVFADGMIANANCRLWVITEWLRVEAAGLLPQGHGVARPTDALLGFLSARPAGLWAERWDASKGAYVEEPVFASSFYHIMTGLLPLIEYQAAF